ncbi:MAG: hypothetical protein C0463_03225 [Idiomarina sp.]|nr:hypothetical protein [Idiomarina sp.]
MFPESITGRVNASTDVSDVRIELIDVDTQQVLANSSGNWSFYADGPADFTFYLISLLRLC